MRHIFVLALAAILLGVAATAHAQPSFNCDVRLNPTERAICNDRGLSRLDRDMAVKFFAIAEKLGGTDRTKFRQDQSEWLGNRNACGAAAGCIRANYVYRIGQFDALTGGGPSGPAESSTAADSAAPDQPIVTVLADGTIERRYPDGRKTLRRPDGQIVFVLPDGTMQAPIFSQVPGAALPPLPAPLQGWGENLEESLLAILDNILADQEYSAYQSTEAGKTDYKLIDWRLRSITFLTGP